MLYLQRDPLQDTMYVRGNDRPTEEGEHQAFEGWHVTKINSKWACRCYCIKDMITT